jgi:uncharacterized RDD family membrane protein YckC
VSGVAPAAGLARRLAASAYEALLLAAVLFAIGFALLPLVTPGSITGSAPAPTLYRMSASARLLSGTVMLAACGLYCGSLWSAGRRTLAMKTWHLVLRTSTGAQVAMTRAIVRYFACWAGPALAIGGFAALEPLRHARWSLALLAFNYVWALIDRDQQFFQDRVAGTRLLLENSSGSR